jgi:hypothetical protein
MVNEKRLETITFFGGIDIKLELVNSSTGREIKIFLKNKSNIPLLFYPSLLSSLFRS